MYEISHLLKEYFAELDPLRRREILDSLPADDDTEFLRALYASRYSDHENKGRKNVDWWLWRCICLQILYGRGRFLRTFRNREVAGIIGELFMNDSHHTFLYHEYRNTARRYLSTCNSANYASRMMGFRQASDEEKVIRACQDIWQMSAGIAKSAGVEAEMHLWVESFRDELYEYSPVCREEYERLNK